MSGALSLMWNIFNTLQLETALPRLAVSPPANVISMGEKFEDIVNFQVVDKEVIYEYLIGFLVVDVQVPDSTEVLEGEGESVETG